MLKNHHGNTAETIYNEIDLFFAWFYTLINTSNSLCKPSRSICKTHQIFTRVHQSTQLTCDFATTQRIKPHPKQDLVRWLVGGSVNLSGTLDQFGMVDLINDFVDVPLPMLTRQDVAQFFTEMLGGRGVEFDKTMPKRLIELLGQPIPLFLQMITQDIYRLWKKRQTHSGSPKPLTIEDLETIFDNFIKSSPAKDKLQHYYSRIQRYYASPQDVAAYELLSKLSLNANGLPRQTLYQEFARVIADSPLNLPSHEQKQRFNQLLRDLENDFYVVEISDEHYDFASGVMKAWWRKYYA